MKNPHTHLGCKGFVLDVICYTACTFRCLFTPSESAKQDFEKEHNGGTENITDCIKELIHMVFLLYGICVLIVSYRYYQLQRPIVEFVTLCLFTSNYIGIIIIISY